MKKNLCLGLSILLLFSISTFGQDIIRTSPTPPVSEKEDILKISTTLIQVDVTVTDDDGRAVSDLKIEDFEIYENGKKQDITNFSFFSINKSIENNKQIAKNDKNAILIPPVTLKPNQVQRTYALVVDDLGLNFFSISKVKDSLRNFINEQMQEGDLVAIIRTGSGIGAMQSFTSDKRQLLAAVEKINWNSYGRGGISTFAPIEQSLKQDIEGTRRPDGSVKVPVGIKEDKAFESRVTDYRNENFSIGTLGALNYVIRGMGQLPGRKAVMLFSEGFKLTYNNNPYGNNPNSISPNRILDGMKVLADMANRASVVIYTLDPRGLEAPGMANASDNIRQVIEKNFNPASTEDERSQRAGDFLESQQSLRYLAYETGGIPYVNLNNLNKMLSKAIDDHASYYLLGYQPNEDTFDPQKIKFNNLEVKIKKPGLKVRYRSGFFGITDKKLQKTNQNSEQSLMTALTSPFAATDIDLNLYPVYQHDDKIGNTIQALIYIDAKDLTFTESTTNKRKANFDLVAMTFGDNGSEIDKFSKNYTIEITDKIYQNMIENGFIYTLPVPIKKSGAYQFRIALRDTNSNKIGSVSQFIEVPDVKNKLVLSNVVLNNFTPAEWQELKLNKIPENGEKTALFDTVLRRFKRGTILRYDYMIYNSKRAGQLETRMRLIRDGKVIYEVDPSPLKAIEQADPARLQSSGIINLGTNLPTGNYILQTIVAEHTAKGKDKFATQFVEFEVIE